MRVSKDYLLNRQYHNADKFLSRVSLHQYGTNPEPFWPWIFKHYPIFPGNKILEVGCGPGGFWKDVADFLPENCEIVLTDLSLGMLQTARASLINKLEAIYEVADVESLPYQSQQFDIVIAHFMLYHAHDIAKAIREMKRVLKSSGYVGILLPSEHNAQMLFDLLGCENPVQAKNFSAEMAAQILPQYFSEIKSYVYQNQLKIPEAEPLLSYIKSLPTMDEKNDEFYYQAKLFLLKQIGKNKYFSLENSQTLYLVSN